MSHYPITLTLNAIREHRPCQAGWEKLLKHLGKTKADDEPLLLESVLDSNGLDDALWCLRALDQKVWGPNCRMYAVWCAKQVEHLMADERSKNALIVAQKHALGKAADEELAAARDVAWDAAVAAARDVAWDAAWAAAWDAAWAAARDVAWDAAWAAARDVARDAQAKMFRKMCNGNAPWQVKA